MLPALLPPPWPITKLLKSLWSSFNKILAVEPL